MRLVVAAIVAGLVVSGSVAHAAKRAKKPAATPAPVVTATPTALVSGSAGSASAAAAATPTPAPTPHARPPAAKVLAPAPSGSVPVPALALEPVATVNGGVALATVEGLVAGDVVSASFAGEPLPVTASEKGYATFLVGVDLNVSPGKYDVTARVKRGGKTIAKTASLKVTDAKYEVQKLTLPKDKVSEFDAPTLARIEREAKDLASLWPQWDADRRWSGKFIKPLPGEWSELFGGRRILNGELRSPHAGIDQRGKEGEPIRSINAGTVVYEGDQFFTGNVTVVDHGQGVYSMYCHQSKYLVKVGDHVRKGEAIGLVGHTGRATGPHLHWGVRVAGARVDPQKLLALDLPETPGAPAMVADTAGDALPIEPMPAAIATSSGTSSASAKP